jgi:hypothetical protein
MTRSEIYQRLETAQALLSDIYEFAGTNQLTELENLMSMADTMIVEAFEEIECGQTAEVLKGQ